MHKYSSMFPDHLREQGAHDKETFNACPHQMLTANVDSKYLLADHYARAFESCSKECASKGRCWRSSG